jgi:hypothetical protein
MGILAISLTIFSFLRTHRDRQSWPGPAMAWVFILSVLVMWWLPSVAVGALLGNTKRGMIIGVALIAILVLAVWSILPTVY